MCLLVFFFCKQKTAYEMRISDWSSDVCSSDLDQSHKDHQMGAADAQNVSQTHAGELVADFLEIAGALPQEQRPEQAQSLRLIFQAQAQRLIRRASARSDERRGGKEGGSTGRMPWPPDQ